MSLFIFSSSSGFATWQRILQFNAGATVNASFFFNEQRGFVATDGQNGIMRTSDGGKTWSTCIIPIGYAGFFTDMFMKDSLNGWVTIEDGNNFSHGLWSTTDGGVSWQGVPTITGALTSVYQTPSAVIIGDRYTIYGLSISMNGGANFGLPISHELIDGINFVDDLHGVASAMSLAGPKYFPVLWTNNGGLSWTQSLDVKTEAWGVYAQKGTANFFIAGERNAGDISGWQNVYESSDYGVTWQTVGVINGLTTGHIGGVGSVIYTQSLTRWQFNNTISGMNRSTDGGRSWTSVGGPSNFRDTRFSVTGCEGAVVYAFDENGGVWKTTDGGDGQIHEPPHNPNLSPDHIDLTSTLCNTATAQLNYSNLSCNQLQIESIGFIDSTDPLVTTGALSFNRYPTLPQTLNPSGGDYLVFNWDPKKLGVQKQLSTTYVKVHSTMLNGTLIFDTLFAINSQSFASQPVFTLSAVKVNFDSMNICRRFIDTTVSFTNENCDTLWLDSTLLTASQDWQLLDRATLTPLTLPIGVAHGESASFVVQFIPSSIGAQKANLLLHFIHQGLTRDTSLSFSGLCFRKMNVLAENEIKFLPTPICLVRDSVITFHNLNCDTLTVSAVSNISSEFSDISGITFPYQVPPGDSLRYRIRYISVKNVTSNANIIFHYNIAQDSNIWETKLSGTGLPGSSLFETSQGTSQLIFPDRVSCSAEDSLIFTIHNQGCDSLTMLGSALGASGLPAISYRTDPALPAVLSKPADQVRVCVYLQAGNPSTNDGTLDFSYQLSDGSRHDSLFTIHALVIPAQRIASISETPVDMGMGSLCTDRDTSIVISNPACPPLTVKDITLTGNYYTITNPRATPFILAEGESHTIHLAFIPTTSGTETGQLQLITDADVKQIYTVPLTSSTKPIDHVTFKLLQENTGIRAGDTAIFAVVPDNDWGGKGLQNIDFSITTNGNLLTYDGNLVQANNTFQTIVTPVSLSGGLSQLNVQLKSPTEIILHKDQPLVHFYFATALTDTINTSVSLSLLSLNNADPHYLNCVLSPASQDGDFTLAVECGSKTLLDFIHGKVPIEGGEAHPNPVTSQTNYQATLPFMTSTTGTAEITYFDALGKQVGAETIVVDKPGKYTAHFDGSQISGGSYEYFIRFRENSVNSVRGRIVVLK